MQLAGLRDEAQQLLQYTLADVESPGSSLASDQGLQDNGPTVTALLTASGCQAGSTSASLQALQPSVLHRRRRSPSELPSSVCICSPAPTAATNGVRAVETPTVDDGCSTLTDASGETRRPVAPRQLSHQPHYPPRRRIRRQNYANLGVLRASYTIPSRGGLTSRADLFDVVLVQLVR
jgi:hypothetical protein